MGEILFICKSSIGSDIGGTIRRSILLSIILVWSIIVDVMSVGTPILGSLGIDWLIILGGIGTSICSVIQGYVSSGIDRDVGSNILGNVSSDISRRIGIQSYVRSFT